MSEHIDIRVEERQISCTADELEAIYKVLSTIKKELEDAHDAMIRTAWMDDAAQDFSDQFKTGMERLWDLMIAVDNMEGFLKTANEMYTAAEKKVLSL